MEIKYYVGIDFGAGETSASYYDITGNLSGVAGEKLHRLALAPTGDVTKVYSAMKKVGGKWQIITDPANLRCSDLRVDFKKRVSSMKISEKEDIKQFWILVFESILEHNKFLKYSKASEDRNFRLVTAHPSAWSQTDVKDYLSLMKEAGLPVDNIIKESDAVYIKWQENIGDKNALIIDCGSSTIDLTLLKNGNVIDSAFVNKQQSGAHRIEELLLDFLRKTDKDFDKNYNEVNNFLRLKAPELNLDKALELYVRSVKENYYTYSPEEIAFTLKKRPFTNGPGDLLETFLSRNAYERIINPYVGEISRFFGSLAKDFLSNGIKIDFIVLSGGASRMPFIRQAIEDGFGKRVDIFHDKNDADYVVSDGLALFPSSYNNKQDISIVTIKNIVDNLCILESNIHSLFSHHKKAAKAFIRDAIQNLLPAETISPIEAKPMIEHAITNLSVAALHLDGINYASICIELAKAYYILDNHYEDMLRWAKEAAKSLPYSAELRNILKKNDYDKLNWAELNDEEPNDNSEPQDDPVIYRLTHYD